MQPRAWKCLSCGEQFMSIKPRPGAFCGCCQARRKRRLPALVDDEPVESTLPPHRAPGGGRPRKANA